LLVGRTAGPEQKYYHSHTDRYTWACGSHGWERSGFSKRIRRCQDNFQWTRLFSSGRWKRWPTRLHSSA